MSDDAIEVHLPPEDHERLRRLARASGKSQDEVVREGLKLLDEKAEESSPKRGISAESIEYLIKLAEGQTYVKERVRGGKW